jgi:DNA repair protein RadC
LRGTFFPEHNTMSTSWIPTLKALHETPTARIYAVGANAASLVELLGAVLGNPDTALAVLNQFPTLEDIAHASNAELESIEGIGKSSAARIRAALELGRRLVSTMPHERPLIGSPADAANLVMSEMSLLESEELRILLLDTRNRVQGVQTVYKGSLNTTMVRVCELYREAIRANCAAIIAVHSHPSGDPSPSPEDIALTRDAVQAGKLLSIELLDHIIVGHNTFVSLHERGLGFS